MRHLHRHTTSASAACRAFSARRQGLLLGAVLLSMVATGCVQRRMTIRTNPPGALVYVDDYLVGVTPVSTDFLYYGKRKFRLERDGFQTLTVEQEIRPPWYQWFPLDFVSENLVPGEIRDERTLDFQMSPQIIPPTDQLIGRGDDLRRTSMAERYFGPMPPATQSGVSPAPPMIYDQRVPAPAINQPMMDQPGQPMQLPPTQSPYGVQPGPANYPPPMAPQNVPNNAPTFGAPGN